MPPQYDAQAVASRLRAARAYRDWTQMHVAEKAGVSVDTVRRSEEGRFSIVSLIRLAEAYGKSLEHFVYGKEG